jgi:type IV pilus assembly protein PilQ
VRLTAPLLIALSLLAAGVSEARAQGAPAVAAKRRAPVKRITLDVYQADIHNVLRLFADVSGANFVVADDVKGDVTIKLKNVPWLAAMKTVLALEGLDYEKKGNIYRIAPQARLEQERRAALARAEEWREKAPLTTRIIPVSYAEASELLPLVKSLLSERGKATFDRRTNVLIVRDVKGSEAFDL